MSDRDHGGKLRLPNEVLVHYCLVTIVMMWYSYLISDGGASGNLMLVTSSDCCIHWIHLVGVFLDVSSVFYFGDFGTILWQG